MKNKLNIICVALVSLILLSTNVVNAQQNFEISNLKKVVVYSYPFGRKLRLGITPKTIKKKAIIKVESRNIEGFPFEERFLKINELINKAEKVGNEELGDVRLLYIFYLKSGKRVKLFVSTSGKFLMDKELYKMEDDLLKLLMMPLEDYFKPKSIKN